MYSTSAPSNTRRTRAASHAAPSATCRPDSRSSRRRSRRAKWFDGIVCCESSPTTPHRPADAAAIARRRRGRGQVDHVPIVPRVADVLHRREHRRRRVGADRPVPRAPAVERVGQHAERIRRPCAFGRTQSGRIPIGLPAERTTSTRSCWLCAKMPPVVVEPIEGVDERRPRRVRQPGVPQQTVAGQLVDIVDFLDFDHGRGWLASDVPRAPNRDTSRFPRGIRPVARRTSRSRGKHRNDAMLPNRNAAR